MWHTWQASCHPALTLSAHLRVILENGERIAALGALREAENRLLSARPRPNQAPPPGLALLQAAISHAGRACAPQVPPCPCFLDGPKRRRALQQHAARRDE